MEVEVLGAQFCITEGTDGEEKIVGGLVYSLSGARLLHFGKGLA